MKAGKNLGESRSFTVVGATVADNFGLGSADGFPDRSLLDRLT